MKKVLLLLAILVLVVFGFYFWPSQKQAEPNVVNNEQVSGQINDVAKADLLTLAKNHILSKPKLALNALPATEWEEQNYLKNVDPEWITAQKVNFEYVPVDKYQGTPVYLNGKYIVSWFFIPGCEEDPKSQAKPNWSKNGVPCLGGYNLRVLINADLSIDRVELMGLE